MRMPRLGVRGAQALVLALAVSCGEASDIGVPAREEALDDGWKAFRAEVVESPVRPGVFIVEGDIAIHGEEALRQYYKKYVKRGAQALTVYLNRLPNDVLVDDIWNESGKHELTYCIGAGFSPRSRVVEAMKLAAEAWNRRVGVTFRHLESEDVHCINGEPSTNATVLFDVWPAPEGEAAPYGALAFFPSLGQKTIFISPNAFNTGSYGRTLVGTLTHELGHVLGFRHEQIWTTPVPAQNCPNPDNPDEDLGQPGHQDDARLLVGGYDVLSVMHYPECRPPGSVGGYSLSETDYRAAISLYGLAPSLIVSAVLAL